MVLQKSHSVSSSDSDEERVTNWEPLTQLGPDDRATSAEQEISQVNTPKKSSKKVQSIFTIEDLTPDDEVFTLQCPQEFNKQELCNKSIDFSQLQPTITSNNELYQLEHINTEKKSITLAIPKKTHGGALVNLPLKGHVVVKKVVDVACAESEDADVCDRQAVAYPSDIKIRHPLLGADWKSHIDLVNEVLQKKKLLLNKEKKDKSSKTSKHKKSKKESSDSDTVTPKKKKKHA